MVGLQHITITVRYEPGVRQGLSLAWIAPELEDAGLALTQEQLDAPMPSRTWVGSVDGRTFERFAESWVLPPKNKGQSASALDDGKDIVSYAHLRRHELGSRWQVTDHLRISALREADLGAFTETCASTPRRGGDPSASAVRSPTRRPLTCTSAATNPSKLPARGTRERAGA
jgi:hypothetical protein